MTVAIRPQPKRELRAFLDAHAQAIGMLLPKGDDPNRYIAATAMEIAKNPKIAECEPLSVLLSIQRAAQLGLEIGRTAYLIPRMNRKVGKMLCSMQTHYLGEIELAVAAKACRAIDAGTIYEGEARGTDWEYIEGLDTKFWHRKNWAVRQDPRTLSHAYAIIRRGQRDGDSVVMIDRAEIERRRARGGNENGDPWIKDYDKMAQKCAIRAGLSTLPRNPRLAAMWTTVDTLDDEIATRISAAIRPDATVAPSQLAAGADVETTDAEQCGSEDE